MKKDEPKPGAAPRFYRCRPEALKKEPFSTRLPKWIMDWLKDQDESQSVLIESALVSHYGLSAPKSVNPRRTQS